MTNHAAENYVLATKILDGKRIISFANNSDRFIEVIFTLDGRDVKSGIAFTTSARGYGYPPKLDRAVKTSRDDVPLPFSRHGGEVAAYIFSGTGRYRDEDIHLPTFMRNRIVKKMKFWRGDNESPTVLTCRY